MHVSGGRGHEHLASCFQVPGVRSSSTPPLHSRTSSRVTPGQAARGQRRRDDPAVREHGEHVGAGALADVPGVLSSSASLAPRSCAQASATTFSAYDVVFSPATAERSLRGQGTVTSVVVGGQALPGLTTTATVGGASPAARAERRRPPRSP